MVEDAKGWLKSNSTLAYFLFAQFVAAGALTISGIAYGVQLENRVYTMEHRGAAYTVARLDEAKLKIAILEDKIEKNEDSIKRIIDIMTRELGRSRDPQQQQQPQRQ